MSARKVNYNLTLDGVRVRVMCPQCEAGGAQYLFSYIPKCHLCSHPEMLPASNTQPECSWEEAREYYSTALA